MTASAIPAGVFVSYSHADREWPRRFDVMLQPEVREGRLDVWVDTDVDAGDNWRSRIDAAIERASVALLLVSPDFLASRFIMNEELPALAAAGVRMVPVLLRHCLWDRVPVLTQVQWAHDPVRDGALATAHGSRRDEQIVRVCQRLLDLLPRARVGAGARAAASTPQPEPPAETSLALTQAPGRLYGVPPLPPAYLPRKELADLRSTLVNAESGAVGVAGDVHALGLSGQGGIGKTVLAVGLARDEDVARYFPAGIFWVNVGERADILALQLSLLQRLGVATENPPRTVSDGVRALRSAFAALRCLVVVDDAWSLEAAAAFRITGPRGRVLYTSRDPALLRAVAADVRPVGLLEPGAARLMLATGSGLPVEALPPEADRVLAGTGGVALALALAGAAVRGGTPWAEVAGGLERRARTYGVHPFANAFKALDTALRAIPSELADAYLTLAVFPATARVPLSVCQRYWQQVSGRTAGQTRTDLAALADRKLLIFDGETIGVHDLQHDYLLLQADDLASLHRELLLSFRRMLDPDGRWFRLPADEPYLWDALLKHLRGAELRDEVIATATDPAYIAARAFVCGVHAAESDLRRAAELHPMRQDVTWLRNRFAQISHLLSGLPSVQDVAVTLALHLGDAPPPLDLTLLRPLLPRRCPSPAWGLAERSNGLLRVIEADDGEVTALAWTPDGGMLATCGTDGTVSLWDPSTAERIGSLDGHRGTAWAATFSPDGRMLVTGEDDGTVGVWDAGTRRSLGTLGEGGRRTRALAFSPDGGLLATGGEDGTLRLWDVGDRKPRWSSRGHPGGISDVCFSADGATVASAGGTVRLWRVDSGHLLGSPQKAGRWATTIRFTSDGRLVVGDTGGDVVLYDGHPLRPVHTTTGHEGGVWSLAVAPEDDVLAVGSGAGAVHLHPLEAERAHGAVGEHRRGVRTVRFSPDGRTVASGGADGRVCVWDTTSNDAYGVPRHADGVEALAVSVHGTQLATTGTDHVVRIFDTVTRRVVATFRGHTDTVSSMAFSPSDEWIASAGADRTARVWRARQPDQFRVLTAHTDAVSSVAFSLDGHRLATAGADRAVRVWEGPEWELLRTLRGHSGWVRAVAFSADGLVLATGGSEGAIRLWNPDAGQLRSTLSGHPGGTRALAFRRHGSGLLSAGADGCVRLWRLGGEASPEELWRASHPVELLTICPDGDRFACAVDDDMGTLRIAYVDQDDVSVTLRLGTPVTSLSWGAAGLGVGTRGSGSLLLRQSTVSL